MPKPYQCLHYASKRPPLLAAREPSLDHPSNQPTNDHHEQVRIQQFHTPHPSLAVAVCPALLHHLTTHPHQKDGQIFNASQKYNWDSIPVNSMMSTPYGLELHCKFGSVCADILTHVYNLRISYPNDDILRSSTTWTLLVPSPTFY